MVYTVQQILLQLRAASADDSTLQIYALSQDRAGDVQRVWHHVS